MKFFLSTAHRPCISRSNNRQKTTICHLIYNFYNHNEHRSANHGKHSGSSGKKKLFTTLLQSGFEVITTSGTAIGDFLLGLNGFTREYLADKVETIFLNGTPVDNFRQQVAGEKCTIALSAAMPGLAGAIFRKNSIHSSLRTNTEALQSDLEQHQKVIVTLKLFNSIAREKGEDLLESGIVFTTEQIITFLEKRPARIKDVLSCTVENSSVKPGQLLSSLRSIPKIKLQVVS